MDACCARDGGSLDDPLLASSPEGGGRVAFDLPFAHHPPIQSPKEGLSTLPISSAGRSSIGVSSFGFEVSRGRVARIGEAGSVCAVTVVVDN